MTFHYLIFIWFCFLINFYSINCLESSQTSFENINEFIDEKDFETIVDSFNRRFISINNCYNNKLIDGNAFCRCFLNKTQIRRISSIKSDDNRKEISFEKLSVVLLTHVLQSRVGLVGLVGLVCKTIKKNERQLLSKECLNSYEEYVSQLSNFIDVDIDYNSTKLLESVDPFLRETLKYYATNNTDQCFSTEDIIKEFISYGELHIFDHDNHDNHEDHKDNSDDSSPIELFAALIVKKLINGFCVKFGESDYLNYLFSQYGTDSSDRIGEEGFERLLRDLSIGNSKHTIEDHNHEEHHHSHEDDDHHNHEEHDHNHNDSHKHKKRSIPLLQIRNNNESKYICLNDNFYMKTFTNDGYFTLDQMKNLCPVLLQQIVSRVCINGNDYHNKHDKHSHKHFHKEEVKHQKESTTRLTNTELYGYSSLAVLIISLTAILGIFILPLMSKHSYDNVMVCFIGLAFGTLSGDALLHLIPSALGIHSHEKSDEEHSHRDSHNHESDIPDYIWYQLCLLGSIYGLFLFEVIINAIYSDDESSHTSHGHSHSMKPDLNRNTSLPTLPSNDSTVHMTSYSGSVMTLDTNSVGTVKSTEDLTPNKEKMNSVILEGKTIIWGMTPLAVMITIGDAIHNFGDGLAIGVAFSTGFASGIATSLAVLCHEIPHELGDFAVLLSTGLTVKRAAIINFVSALTAFIGLYIGIILGENQKSQNWVLALCAGIFLYVALTNMLPELKQKSKSSHQLVSIALKNFGVLLGIGCMFVIAIYEDRLHFD